VESGASLGKRATILSRCIHLDLDLYAGTFLSITLLVLVSLSLSDRSKWTAASRLDSEERTGLGVAHLVFASLMVVTSVSGVWMVRRHRFLCLNDSDHAMRRDIRAFLRSHAEDSETTACTKSMEGSERSKRLGLTTLTAQTEVFPVYRRHESTASWNKLPSLLLVEGDWIALQIGDIAPAACRSEIVDGAGRKRTVQAQAGERLSISTFGITPDHATMHLPRGRSTLTADSTDNVLTLCNNMRIFTLEETPLLTSLNQQNGASGNILSLLWVMMIEYLRPLLVRLTQIVPSFSPIASSAGISVPAIIPGTCCDRRRFLSTTQYSI
jgi:hypothetical protein